MSRLLYRLSYPALVMRLGVEPAVWAQTQHRAPMQNRTADLLLTMETLYRLSYRGQSTFKATKPTSTGPNHP